ncbi:hypothetical protein [Flagellimonas allohymeniacidonis]|uniref:Uncharacterized protein n=1 Tax=Flagellimonas allohymeniacidonis TaxID=2517819 RepID=A0A4Q8QF26_9FLAO|nr:hypothetical protein [Allomuricauda hymeniacidonis]TAI49075.1 hypothetical protein EW142_04585 [Allomuricauda hymeniacidonis]
MHFNFKKATLCAVSILMAHGAFAQNQTPISEVNFYESVETVKAKIGNHVLSHSVLSLDQPTFPLAKDSEIHLLCTNLKTEQGILAQVVFTFADDQLQYIEARGNAVSTLIEARKDTAQTFMGYKVLFKERIFGNMEKDIVWILTEEAMHPNLFTWENPYLTKGGAVEMEHSVSAEIPDFIEMGADLETLRPLFEANSSFVHEQKLDGSDPNAQLQLNCFGVDYAGFPRKIEARFGDGKLNVVWILTGKGEEDRLRKKLVAQYGEPIFVNDAWEMFENWTIGLRKDKPEVLLLTPELGQFYKTEYFKQ